MKKIKRFFLPLLALLIILSSAIPAYAEEYSQYPYDITAYDIEMNVLENNTLQITERIDVHFNEYRHGIYRVIPTTSTIKRADGTTGTIKALVKHVKVNDNFSTELGGGEYTLKIGDEDRTVIGNKSYTITYDYVMGQDINSGFDELYYNIIGNGWETTISNVTFTINMPKDFDPALLGFSTGEYGTVGTNDVPYEVKENTITGRVTEPLNAYESVTIRLQLPEGYFSFNAFAYYAKIAAMPIISLIVLIVVIVLWSKFGKDKKVVEVVEFYPPEGMSSADVAYWKKGMVANDDLIGLLIELANEGYLELEDVDEKRFVGKKEKTKITLLADSYRGTDQAKRDFFNGLKKYSTDNVVYDDDLSNVFYETLTDIASSYNSSKSHGKVFDPKSMGMMLLGILISIASIILNVFIMTNIISGPIRTFAFIASAVISVISLILAFFIRRRTDEGHEKLQKIKGFEMFLETAEKEKLEALVEGDPQYFYGILPYAYVLGVTDKWIGKFKDIAYQPATWYRTNGVGNYMMYRYFMLNSMGRLSQSMTSAPRSSSSGVSGGGGGFAGGGAGGGGGGSW